MRTLLLTATIATAAALATPAHNYSRGVEVAVENFIPSDYATSVLSEEVGHVVHDMVLQLGLACAAGIVFEAKTIGLGLAFGTLHPAGFGALIASDMK